MLNKLIQPDNPLTFIRRCVQQRKIFWTYHINMRLQKRGISRQMILDPIEWTTDLKTRRETQ